MIALNKKWLSGLVAGALMAVSVSNARALNKKWLSGLVAGALMAVSVSNARG